MEEATLFYERHLLTNSAVKEYLTGRGLSEETIRSFRIGYAPNEWRLAYDHLRGKGYSDSEIEKAGLIKPTEGKSPYDRFRGRVMFPIFDANGSVIAFSGRVFGEQKNQDGTDVAKYINSPEGPLYDKSSVMFGYDRARKTIREQNFTILVEGQMDLIMSHQAGTLNTVAVSGTALTERHLALLKRLSDKLVFAFDADDAGLKATARAFGLALADDMDVHVAAIPDGKDPADYIKIHGAAGWSKVIASQKDIIVFYLASLRSREKDNNIFRKTVIDQVFPLLSLIRNPLKQNSFISDVARYFADGKDSISAVRDEVTRQIALNSAIIFQTKAPIEPHRSPAPTKPRRQVAEEEIIGILIWQEGVTADEAREIEGPAIDVDVHRAQYHERLSLHGLTPHSPPDDEKDKLALKAEYKYEHSPKLSHSVAELLDTIEEEVLKEKQAELWAKLSDAEARAAKDEAKEFLKAYQEITPRIIALEDRKLKRVHPEDE